MKNRNYFSSLLTTRFPHEVGPVPLKSSLASSFIFSDSAISASDEEFGEVAVSVSSWEWFILNALQQTVPRRADHKLDIHEIHTA